MTPAKSYDPALARAVLEFGREGLSRAEMAAQLGVPVAALEAWAAEHPAFAEALALADTEARAWWDGLPRRALLDPGGFRSTIWSRAMAQRYGRSGHRPRPAPEAAEAEETGAEAGEPRARVELPRNGREVRAKPGR